MHLLNQPALGADPLQVTDHEHANHEFGIDRGPPDAAVVPGHALAHEAEIQQPVDLPQRVVGWDMILEAKDVEQRLRRSCRPIIALPPHNNPEPANHATATVQPPSFSPKSSAIRKHKMSTVLGANRLA